ncbi:MAG: coproporphyrinogen-III oxidase family protein [Gemmatales bacterium]|nr:coproporphyrinogen III oxidase family protein [Gemmatales bacterium]MDW7994779.1 coproporphyrinogen-III oxidase family protein [Gemmatales bacterium]
MLRDSSTAAVSKKISLAGDQEKTGLGNYFIANYPPFSFWTPQCVEAVHAVLSRSPQHASPLGLYVHIPFCRKRCKFCYFRVYTDKNARDIEEYLQRVLVEVSIYSSQAAIRDRSLDFVYFGGGTPSYLSARQLRDFLGALKRFMPWEQVKEVTFECEPGTLQRQKLEVLRELGITRLSLGVENFNDTILEENGRAHRSAEIFRAYQWIQELAFPQVNIDLIAGMVGETWENWRECIRQTIALNPDSVTIYQMELPYNTEYAKTVRNGESLPLPLADWPTKRAWVDYAFDQLIAAGYEVSSGYTLVRDKKRVQFHYRDALWHGADLLGTGVASFGHIQGVHVQNFTEWDTYLQPLREGRLPLYRAYVCAPLELCLREFILQLKTGRVEFGYFLDKYGERLNLRFGEELHWLSEQGFAQFDDKQLVLTRAGLLQVDRLLPIFFLPQHRTHRYV